MIDFTEHVRSESAQFAAAVRSAGPDALNNTVPACPDWRLADLVWHLSQVQDFWIHILDRKASGPEEYDRPERPDDVDLLDFLVGRSEALVPALDRGDDEPCWSWSPKGGTVGSVRRRQAQEALVHRIDAELAVDAPTAIDEELAADGVDEILRVMLDADELPPWASFNADNHAVVLDTGDRWWSLRLGRVVGVDPDGDDPDGPGLDLRALSVADAGEGGGEGAAGPNDTRIVGSAANLNLWLWGRTGPDSFEVVGDPTAVAQLRATAADATQ